MICRKVTWKELLLLGRGSNINVSKSCKNRLFWPGMPFV